MQLSEAIRLGAMLKPQAFGAYEKDGRTCALGAAAEAVRMRPDSKGDRGFSERWPFVDVLGVACPMCAAEMELGCNITHLNDDHRWTREAIADWVATVEPAIVTPALEMVAV